MKSIIFIVTILLCTSSICAAEERTYTGNELLNNCNNVIAGVEGRSHDMFVGGYCLGYVDGIDDALNILPIENFDRGYCRPKNVTAGQLVRVVVKYLKNHPEKLHENQFLLTLSALLNAFPCK